METFQLLKRLWLLVPVLMALLATHAAGEPKLAYPAGSEISIVLEKNRFYPSEIRLQSGLASTLVFSTVNKKPAALVIEPTEATLQMANRKPQSENELNRELSNEHVTAISFEPLKGKYLFHDALGEAHGVIIVE